MKSRVLSLGNILLSLALVALLVAALTWAGDDDPKALGGKNTASEASSEASGGSFAAKKVKCGPYGKQKKCNDADGDGIPDKKDKDDDNDGIKDAKDKDDDGDGIKDGKDKDDDNDGVPDKCEKLKKKKAKKKCIKKND
ncbi:MAG: hypothetical protein M3271_11500 [Actinomycetota bacterium]|nr:hypothetical protein [Actinomycetota bacterium]